MIKNKRNPSILQVPVCNSSHVYTTFFQKLLMKVSPLIVKQDTIMRDSIPQQCLAITLRFLATGESHASLEFQFRISRSTLSMLIPTVCQAIYKVLHYEYLKCPSTPEEWLKIAKVFEDRWNFPNCIGAGDGKHIRIRCPPNTGSDFYNYKSFFSSVLLAFVGPQYQFLYLDVGCQGSASDSSIFRRSTLWQAIQTNTINITPPRPLPESHDPIFEVSDIAIDYFFVCDDAFPLGKHLVKPYSSHNLTEERRIFNYRLSRARRISENAFGLLASRFRIFHTVISLKPENVTSVILACCSLLNYLIQNSPSYALQDSMDVEVSGDLLHGSWRNEVGSSKLETLPKCKQRCPKNEEDMRDIICDFVNGPGAISWQWKVLVP